MEKTVYITRQDFETFVELLDGFMYRRPDHSHSAISVTFKLSNDVQVQLDATALHITKSGRPDFYGRNVVALDWNVVALYPYLLKNVHKTGKGARSEETNALLREAFSVAFELLPGGDIKTGLKLSEYRKTL